LLNKKEIREEQICSSLFVGMMTAQNFVKKSKCQPKMLDTKDAISYNS